MRDALIHFLSLTTELGDSALTASLTALLSAYLLYFRERRAALAMLLAFALSGLVVALGKILLYADCAAVAIAADLRSPSGHTAVSCAVYGTAALIVGSRFRGLKHSLPLLATAALVLTIAISRVALGAHTVPDVLAGLAVGAAVCFGLWRTLLRDHPARCPWKPALVLCLLCILALYGLHAPSETFVRWLATYLHLRANLC